MLRQLQLLLQGARTEEKGGMGVISFMVQFFCFCIGKMQKISPHPDIWTFSRETWIFSPAAFYVHTFCKITLFEAYEYTEAQRIQQKRKIAYFAKIPRIQCISKQHRHQLTPKKCVSHFIKFGLFSRFFMAKKGFEVCICVSLFVQLSMNCPKQASNAPSNAFIGILILLRFFRTEKGKSSGGDLRGLKEDEERLQNWTGGRFRFLHSLSFIHFHRYFIGSVSFSIRLFPPWTSIIESSFREIKAV